MTSIRVVTSGLALALFAGVLVSPLVASAQGVTKTTKTEQCRLIKAKSDREACYTRQEAELAKKKDAAAKPDAVDVDRLKEENDRLTNKLKNICRGC